MGDDIAAACGQLALTNEADAAAGGPKAAPLPSSNDDDNGQAKSGAVEVNDKTTAAGTVLFSILLLS